MNPSLRDPTHFTSQLIVLTNRSICLSLLIVDRAKEKKIKVCFNKPNKIRVPGLLKRTRRVEEEEEEEEEEERLVRTKRIRFNELDSDGRPIEPQFSEDEDTDQDDEDTEQEDDDNSGQNQSQSIVNNIIDNLINCVLKN